MIEISLTKGKFAFIDDEDWDLVKNYKWYYNNNGYAETSIKQENGKHKTTGMHRLIINNNNPKIHIDHINHNGCDNEKYNLRLCTHQQNHMNQSSNKNSTSKYMGVNWEKSRKKWKSQIGFNNKRIFVGYFINEEDAARAYDNKAKELFGEFANLNFKL